MQTLIFRRIIVIELVVQVALVDVALPIHTPALAISAFSYTACGAEFEQVSIDHWFFEWLFF